jgi:hypothetical protein
LQHQVIPHVCSDPLPPNGASVSLTLSSKLQPAPASASASSPTISGISRQAAAAARTSLPPQSQLPAGSIDSPSIISSPKDLNTAAGGKKKKKKKKSSKKKKKVRTERVE